MSAFISVRVVPLEDLFSDSYHFRLPYFQRAYAWRTMEVGRLLSDLAEAASDAKREGYFLGKLMLAHGPGDAETALVDGHQRVMSLTILFSVLRDLETDAARQARLDLLVNGPKTARLSPQQSLADFCAGFVQAPGATAEDPDDDRGELSETERNIVENRDHLRNMLTTAEWSQDRRRQLADFATKKCVVVALSVPDEDLAWSYLRTEETTRLEFAPTDTAKWNILSIVSRGERAKCQLIWDTCEHLLGSDDLKALLGHVLLLRTRKRSEQPVEIDLAKSFKMQVPGQAEIFFESELLAKAKALAAVRQLAPASGRVSGLPLAIRDYVLLLTIINPHIWMPAAMLWGDRVRDSAATTEFYRLLERLIWMMRLSGDDHPKQKKHIIGLLGDIDRGLQPRDMPSFAIPQAMKDAALSNLRALTFDSKHYYTRVLRRISIALGQDPGPISEDAVTVEHLLPRGFQARSEWRRTFPTKKMVSTHAHRLGNLTYLSPDANQLADDKGWAAKRPILAASEFVMTQQVARVEMWGQTAIAQRTEELIKILFSAWDLKA